MVKAVTPSLPEPGVWTGMAPANVLEPLRWKRAKTHRGSRHRHMPHQEAGYTSAAGRIQAVVATESLLADRSNWPSASAGVFQSSVFRGRELRAAATAAISTALCMLRSVPFGKYWRSNPFVFSLVPRCHGLWGSQK